VDGSRLRSRLCSGHTLAFKAQRSPVLRGGPRQLLQELVIYDRSVDAITGDGEASPTIPPGVIDERFPAGEFNCSLLARPSRQTEVERTLDKLVGSQQRER
jgi:hypothetical protein